MDRGKKEKEKKILHTNKEEKETIVEFLLSEDRRGNFG